MALTRRALKAMGIEEEKVDEIIAMHTETVEGLKADIAKYKEDAEKLPTVQKELDALKAAGDGGLQERFDALKREYDEFKGQVTAKEAKTAKESAVRAYYESKGITGKALDIAMRGSAQEIDAIEMDGDKIKDSSALDNLVSGVFSGLVSRVEVQGANTSNPPANNSGVSMTKADIYKKDDHGRYVLSAAERQQALIENHQTTT